jgi:hypothetical protein
MELVKFMSASPAGGSQKGGVTTESWPYNIDCLVHCQAQAVANYEAAMFTDRGLERPVVSAGQTVLFRILESSSCPA